MSLSAYWTTTSKRSLQEGLADLLTNAERVRDLDFNDPERVSFCCYVIGYLAELPEIRTTAPSAPSTTAVQDQPNKKDSPR